MPMTLEEKRAKNREKMRKFREKNPDYNKNIMKKRYHEQHDKYLSKAQEWREANREKVRESNSKYYYSNKESVRSTQNSYIKTRKETDPQFRMRMNVRARLSAAIERKLADKKISASKHLGCTVDELYARIEAMFQPGMTWDNYGTVWHVDHIIPLAAFDLTNEEQQKKACHYSNLQPMFAKENISKSDTMPDVLPDIKVDPNWKPKYIRCEENKVFLRKHNHSIRKPVIAINLDDDTVMFYVSAGAAGSDLNLHTGNIAACAAGNRGLTRVGRWTFKPVDKTKVYDETGKEITNG